MRLVLQLSDKSSQQLAVPLRERLVIGRAGGEEEQPDIDFAAYGAQERGVSRLHAAFTYHDEQIYLEDMNSTNGTRINGFTIHPGKAYRLRNGDEIEFGSLRMMVRLVRAAG
jgi:pSer/pThr/pTyr-binding forkhead associated (FHA) protein